MASDPPQVLKKAQELACGLLANWRSPVGVYRGVTGSVFVAYGLTGAIGVYTDNTGPGIYIRVGVGVGLQASAGPERGIVRGSISGPAVEFEGVGLTRSISGAVSLTGATLFRAKAGSIGLRTPHAMPISGHVAAPFTSAWSAANLCQR